MKNFWIRLKLFFIRLKLKIVHSYDSTFYVNGADTLPPPLAAEEESEALRTAPYDSRSRSLLIEHNLALSSISPKNLRAPASASRTWSPSAPSG